MKANPDQGTISKRVYGAEAHYNLHWSPLRSSDRYEITRSVPAVAGVYELYVADGGRLRRFILSPAWYGGLRAAIRQGTDAEATPDLERRALLARFPCYYRFCAVGSRGDLEDVYAFLDQSSGSDAPAQPSGRYESVTVAVRGELEAS